MRNYVVSYDLIKRKNYPELINVLQSFNFWHCLGSTWIIKSDSSAKELATLLLQHIDDDDKLIVLEVGADCAWTTSFEKQCLDWLSQNL